MMALVKSDQEFIENKTAGIVGESKAIFVRNDDEYRYAAHLLLGIKDTLKEIKKTFEPIKTKVHAAWKETLAQEKVHEDPLLEAERVIKGKIAEYTTEQKRLRLEEEKRLLAEARRREEEERLSRAASLELEGKREEAEAVLERTRPVIAPMPTREEPKIAGIVERETWKCRIVNEALIPRKYLMPNEQAIRKSVQAMGDWALIPGVEVYRETVISAGRRI